MIKRFHHFWLYCVIVKIIKLTFFSTIIFITGFKQMNAKQSPMHAKTSYCMYACMYLFTLHPVAPYKKTTDNSITKTKVFDRLFYLKCTPMKSYHNEIFHNFVLGQVLRVTDERY